MDARSKIIAEATNGESIVGRKELDDIKQSSKFDGFAGGESNKELSAALHMLSLDGGADSFAGSVDNGCCAALLFPYILTEDNQGFCGFVGPYDDYPLCERIMGEYEAEYGDSELAESEK